MQFKPGFKYLTILIWGLITALIIVTMIVFGGCVPSDYVHPMDREDAFVGVAPSSSINPLSVNQELHTIKVGGVNYKIIVLDGCEYIRNNNGNLTHKGNCRNKAHTP